ncbi:MAG: nucleoside recognition domain-containing protein [Anaerolineae bacterium]
MHGAQTLLNEVMTVTPRQDISLTQKLSRLMIHPLWGWTFLLLVLWLVYKFVGEFGAGTLVDFMETTVFGEWINPLATRLVDGLLPFSLAHDLLVGDYGVITMALSYGIALVLPIVTTFFLAFSILEDSGYLPRLAIMFNRVFKMMGLNGKAVLPMILGLGCDTMATLSTRILETRKERIMVTLLLALGVPCSAQLGVILGMLGQVGGIGTLIWASVVVATMMAVGLLAAKLLPGERSDFILELPPLRLPHLDNIAIKTLARLEWYLKEVLPLFIVGTLILFALDKTGILLLAEQVASPVVVGLLGLPAAATGAFLIGFLRRDYGAAGLFAMMLAGQLDSRQVIVSLIVITLFIPCIANVLIIVKEYGKKVAAGVALVVFPLAFAVGGVVNLFMHLFQVMP